MKTIIAALALVAVMAPGMASAFPFHHHHHHMRHCSFHHHHRHCW